MNTILRLFIRNGGLLTFVLVEAFCFYVIVKNNEQQRIIYLHSAGKLTNRLLEQEREVLDYFNLEARADSLNKENARLRTLWENARQARIPYRDTAVTVLFDTINSQDSLRRRLVRPFFEFVPAQVISNTLHLDNNWLIINRGSDDQVTKNSGIISSEGLVGIVWHVDRQFSVGMSLLHQQTKISAALKRQKAFGSLIWEGGDPSVMTLKYIPKHIQAAPGDTVVTSGYSDMFPGGILIGRVDEAPEKDSENPYFLNIKVRLSQDMSTVNDVSVVRNIFYSTIDSLKQIIKK